MRFNLRALCAAAGVAAAAVAVTTCSDESPGPNGPGAGTAVFRPVFAPGVNPAAVNLFIDNVRITLIRPPDELVRDTVVAFSLDSATLRIQLRVDLEAAAESLDAGLELRAGGVVLFAGAIRVLATQGGPPSDPPPTLVLNYVGPGAQVASLQIAPRDTFLLLGDSLSYQVSALDGQGAPVSQFYVSWRTTGATSLINAGALLRAPNARGNTFVVAETPTGVKDSTPVGFVPQATTLVVSSGDNQSAPVSSVLPQPLVVQVRAADGLGVAGVLVQFAVLSGGGQVSPTQAVSDDQGFAQTTATLGSAIGTQTFRAGVAGVTPVTFTATGIAGGSGQLGFAVAPPATAQASEPLTPAPVIQVQDAGGNPVSQAGVTVTANLASGGGTLIGSTTSVTDGNGQATFADLGISGLVGPRTLTFSATGLTSVTSGSIDLVPGVAVRLTIETQPPSTATSGAALSPQPIVRIRDADGNLVSQAGTVVTAVIASSPGGTPSLANATVTTNAVGIAPFSGLALTGQPGDYTLRFDATGLTSATSTTITLGAGAATQLAIITQPSSSAQAGVAFGQQPVVELRDAAGSPVNQSGVSITASFASSPGGTPTLTNPSAATISNGRATFSGLGIAGVVGTYTLRFSATGLTPVVSGNVVLSVGPVSAAVSQLSATPSAMDADSVAFATVSVTARDAGGNVISGAAVVLAVSGSGNTITQPPPTSASGFTQGGFVTFVPGQKIVSTTINTVAIDQR
ncbi:MAG: beta strand repeat-containing protein, partial [Gemmatimonadales bacterium]